MAGLERKREKGIIGERKIRGGINIAAAAAQGQGNGGNVVSVGGLGRGKRDGIDPFLDFVNKVDVYVYRA